MQASILYEDDDIRVIHQPGNSAYTLVTFGGLTHRPDGLRFWGDRFAGPLGIEAIGFMPKREHWYPAAAMGGAAPSVRAALKRRAIGYGFSMGGYAALKYGRLLGLSHALAVSPQCSIVPAEMPRDPRYHRFHDAALHRGMGVRAADLAPFAVVAADPYDRLDAQHIAAAEACGARLLALPFLQHGAVQAFTGNQRIARALRLVLARDLAGLAAFLRRGRAEQPQWVHLLAGAAMRRGHVRMAEALWARARELGVPAAQIAEERASALQQRLRRLVETGRAAEAGRLVVSTRRAGLPGDPAGLARVGATLLQAGEPAAAETAYRAALAAAPESVQAHQGLALALAEQGETAAALATAAEALERLPGEGRIASGLGHRLFARGYPEAAEQAFRLALAGAEGAEAAGLWLAISHTLHAQERRGEALEAVRAALRHEPASDKARRWLRTLQPAPGPRAAPRPSRPAERLAFLHIAKTAGTSFTEALRPGWPRALVVAAESELGAVGAARLAETDLVAGHFYAHQLESERFAGFETVTLLRDPLARLWSSYRFAHETAAAGQPTTPVMRHAVRVSFAEFAFSIPGVVDRHAQLFQLGLDAGDVARYMPLGALLARAKGRLETMLVGTDDTMGLLLEHIYGMAGRGAPPPLPRLMAGGPRGEPELTAAQRAALAEILAPDYALVELARTLMLRRAEAAARLGAVA